jgi:hypothetical protein
MWRVTGCTVTSVGGTAATASNGVITIGSGNTSVTVNNAFSTDYDNYLIHYNNVDASVATNITMTVGNANTGYYYALIYMIYGTVGIQTIQQSNQASWVYAAVASTDTGSGAIEVFSPFLTTRTSVRATYMENAATAASGQFTGYLNNATSYTSFTFASGAGSLTGGTIRVYGYRK